MILTRKDDTVGFHVALLFSVNFVSVFDDRPGMLGYLPRKLTANLALGARFGVRDSTWYCTSR